MADPRPSDVTDRALLAAYTKGVDLASALKDQTGRTFGQALREARRDAHREAERRAARLRGRLRCRLARARTRELAANMLGEAMAIIGEQRGEIDRLDGRGGE